MCRVGSIADFNPLPNSILSVAIATRQKVTAPNRLAIDTYTIAFIYVAMMFSEISVQ